MAVRIKKDFRGKDSGKHPHVKNAQDFPFTPDPHGAWLSIIRQALTDNDYFAARCRDEALPVVTARAALKLLVEYLERNK